MNKFTTMEAMAKYCVNLLLIPCVLILCGLNIQISLRNEIIHTFLWFDSMFQWSLSTDNHKKLSISWLLHAQAFINVGLELKWLWSAAAWTAPVFTDRVKWQPACVLHDHPSALPSPIVFLRVIFMSLAEYYGREGRLSNRHFNKKNLRNLLNVDSRKLEISHDCILSHQWTSCQSLWKSLQQLTPKPQPRSAS